MNAARGAHADAGAAPMVDGVDYQRLVFDTPRHPDQTAALPARHPVVVVGAGPVGLSLAIDLAQRGTPVVLIDDDDRLASGSRAICFAKRTLDIFDRLGCGDRMVAKGVSWNVGRVFFGAEQIYSFDLLPEPGHARPAFVNLQQYYMEGYLAERAAQLPLISLRWKHRLAGITQHGGFVALQVDTPGGPYTLHADHVVACDGGRSAVRRLMGLESAGRSFRDRFLIADVRMQHAMPAERWFWFDPPFHRNQSVLLHRQPDGVWRIDFQLGWDADPDEEKKPENIIPRVQALLAHAGLQHCTFTLEWASVYTFACLRMARFRHGRVLFAGDAAHGVSPFGARGANSGVQDAENLAWKLSAVLQQQAGDALLDSYAAEREDAADENIRHSTRATDFITPKSEISRLFRDAVLALSKQHAFARSLVNSGRLSVPTTLHASPLNTPAAAGAPAAWAGDMVPGAAAADAPVTLHGGKAGWLLRRLGAGFTALVAAGARGDALVRGLLALPGDGVAGLTVLRVLPAGIDRSTDGSTDGSADDSADANPVGPSGSTGLPTRAPDTVGDSHGLVARRYGLQQGTVVLLRPDHHVCARLADADVPAVRAAMQRALARP